MMSGRGEDHIVRIALEGGIFLADGNASEGLPPHQRLRKLERAVLYKLGIETAVGSEVDVFEEDAVHRGLNGSARFIRIDNILMLCIGCGRENQCRREHENS